MSVAAPQSRKPKLPGLRKKEGFLRHPFDAQSGTQTSGLVAGRNLATNHPHDRHNTAYYGVAPSIFQELIARWGKTPPLAALEHYTFIDIGAGMGRALLLAAQMPFRQVIGVELNPELTRIAQKNIRLWKKSGHAQCPMQIRTEDAIEVQFPRNPCVVFLFNPFSGTVLRRLLKQIQAQFETRPNQLDILYVNHEFETILKQNPRFTQLWSGDLYKSPEDEQADREILQNQPEGEYAASDYESCSIYRFTGSPSQTAKTRR
jgi:SAM-dependent methyltransferase